MQPFAPRPIRFAGLRTRGPWTLKLYSIEYGSRPIDWDEFEPGLGLAEGGLPAPDDQRGRPGLGFIIAHQGRTANYVVLGWWDRENELPVRVWVQERAGRAWRPAKEGESFCVWDLQVIWAEREAWVETMLGPEGPDRDAYVARHS